MLNAVSVNLDKEKLLEIYNVTLNYVVENNERKYNLKTVKNLIIHHDKIEEERQELVYNELSNYLVFIRDLEKIGDDKESKLKSNVLYTTFISPLIKFHLSLGFSANVALHGLLFFVIFSVPIFVNSELIFHFVHF